MRYAALALLALNGSLALCQGDARAVTRVIASNALVGGLTAGARAVIGHSNPTRPFVVGVLGGLSIGTGKLIDSRTGANVGGTIFGSVGIALVANSADSQPLAEIRVPIAMLRLRIRPWDDRKIGVAVNAFESALIARTLMRPGLTADWRSSARLGTFVFDTDGREIWVRGNEAQGVTTGPVIVVSQFADDAENTRRHEAIHVQQQRFSQDAWGQPIERFVRTRVSLDRIVPGWIELGVVAPVIQGLSDYMLGHDGLFRTMRENEARALTDR